MPPQTRQTYTLSLHDALPISTRGCGPRCRMPAAARGAAASSTSTRSCACSRPAGTLVKGHLTRATALPEIGRAHELQSRLHLVCRLLLEKKKNHDSHPPIEDH